MSKVTVVSKDGKKVGEETLSSDIFGVDVNTGLVEKIVRAFLAGKRHAIAHTKTRSERRGGGAKPWKQKGTGRARHGSSRSPIWKKGGVTFGPRNERNFEIKVNKKEKKKALFMTLSAKVTEGQLVLIDSLKMEAPKTQEAAQLFSALKVADSKVLVVTPERDEVIEKSFRNIPKVKTVNVAKLNAYDVLNASHCVMPVDSVKAIEKHFLK
jgi:large subunit ribosomal protein L4